MKSLLTIFAVFLFSLGAAHAQEKPKDTPAEKKQEQLQRQQGDKPGFVDEDGDGINDRLQQDDRPGEASPRQLHRRQQRRDSFIDSDGDGINDDRCSGMGVGGSQRRGQRKGGGSQ